MMYVGYQLNFVGVDGTLGLDGTLVNYVIKKLPNLS
jgi:hypothetical protein